MTTPKSHTYITDLPDPARAAPSSTVSRAGQVAFAEGSGKGNFTPRARLLGRLISDGSAARTDAGLEDITNLDQAMLDFQAEGVNVNVSGEEVLHQRNAPTVLVRRWNLPPGARDAATELFRRETQ